MSKRANTVENSIAIIVLNRRALWTNEKLMTRSSKASEKRPFEETYEHEHTRDFFNLTAAMLFCPRVHEHQKLLRF